MKQKFKSISGVTLLEMLIGIVISAIMMAALYTSYSAVNTSYSQVSDRETISRTGRDIIGMIQRDIRMAGYFDVNSVKVADKQMYPLRIGVTKNFTGANRKCDSVLIVYGDTVYNKGATPEYTYPIYKIIYHCKASKVPNRKAKKNAAGTFPAKDVLGIYKQKVSWDRDTKSWKDPNTDNDKNTHDFELVLDHVEDLIFVPIDENGIQIVPAPSTTQNQSRINDIRSVEILLMLRSSDDFFKTKKERNNISLVNTVRNKKKTDKYLREAIVATAHTRNIGISK